MVGIRSATIANTHNPNGRFALIYIYKIYKATTVRGWRGGNLLEK